MSTFRRQEQRAGRPGGAAGRRRTRARLPGVLDARVPLHDALHEVPEEARLRGVTGRRVNTKRGLTAAAQAAEAEAGWEARGIGRARKTRTEKTAAER